MALQLARSLLWRLGCNMYDKQSHTFVEHEQEGGSGGRECSCSTNVYLKLFLQNAGFLRSETISSRRLLMPVLTAQSYL